ncbi:hypothetical protein TNCV_3225511 [Trichonephila clavipes]|nr:hypothetical protein TNCV_3225511 [Trichonephila clavipes]
MFIFSKNGETTLVLPNTLWKPTLASRAAPKNGRTGPELCSFPVLPFFWGRSLGCSQWCPAEGTGITHIQVLQQPLQVKLMATVCLFWPVHRTDGAYVGDLKHGIGPFLCITSTA